MSSLSAPLFHLAKRTDLATEDLQLRPDGPRGQLSLTGPSVQAEEGHLPVRGELAHIKLAGRYFVPHYAAPLPFSARAPGASLRKTAGPDGSEVLTIPEGAVFDVLDIVGGWAWGQFGDEGPVGYVALDELKAVEP